jgi:hypothetical protein
MKYLVVTAKSVEQTKKQKEGFSHASLGEAVTIPALVCEGSAQHAHQCGCDRSFTGVVSNKATTAAEIVEIDLDLKAAAEKCAASWEAISPDCADDFFNEMQEIQSQCEPYPVGTLVEIKSRPTSYALSFLVLKTR